jgi:hypothetical protein
VASPAIADGRVVIGSDDGMLRSFDTGGEAGCVGVPRTCAPVWTAWMDGPVRGSPAIAGHVVYAAGGGELAGYDLAGTRNCDGVPRRCLPLWTTRLPAPVSAPTIRGSQVLVGAVDLHGFRVVVDGAADDLRSATLTAERADTYDVRFDTGDRAHASAPSSNAGGNSRLTFTRAAGATDPDQYSCATWVADTNWHDQEGAALRVHPVPGGVKAVTITKNVYFGANWVFNVHVWDTSQSPPAIQIASFDLAPVFSPDHIQVVPLPWKLCAQVVGSTVSFVAWPASGPRPDWGDASHGGSVTLPAGHDEPGEAGWYIGHLEHDHRAEFADLAAGPTTVAGAPLGGPAAPGTAPRAPTAIPALP